MPYDAEQRRLIALAKRLSSGYSQRVRTALLEAMGVEAGFRNLGYGDRDSEGVLQQRPSQGWGPASESAATDIQQFLARAGKLDRGFRGSAGQLAQAIQRSAFPERYDERASEVARLLGMQLGSGDTAAGGAAASAGDGSPLSSPAAPDNPRLAFARALIDHSRQGRTDVRALLPLLSAIRDSGGTGTVQAPPAQSSPSGPVAAGGSTYHLVAALGLDDAITSGHRPGAVTHRGTASWHSQKDKSGRSRAYDLDPGDEDADRLVAHARRHPEQYEEFYGPVDWHIDGGRLKRGRYPDHDDHFHVVRR